MCRSQENSKYPLKHVCPNRRKKEDKDLLSARKKECYRVLFSFSARRKHSIKERNLTLLSEFAQNASLNAFLILLTEFIYISNHVNTVF